MLNLFKEYMKKAASPTGYGYSIGLLTGGVYGVYSGIQSNDINNFSINLLISAGIGGSSGASVGLVKPAADMFFDWCKRTNQVAPEVAEDIEVFEVENNSELKSEIP